MLAALALLVLFAGAATAASIEAEIDRNEATLEDRLTLTLTVTGAAGGEPMLPRTERLRGPAGGSVETVELRQRPGFDQRQLSLRAAAH